MCWCATASARAASLSQYTKSHTIGGYGATPCASVKRSRYVFTDSAWRSHGCWLNMTMRAPRSAAASTESGDIATQYVRSLNVRDGAGLIGVGACGKYGPS